ncbi:LOW QUALITY PROTEIN: tubulin tyrosine ligase 3-like [Amphiura filiformis]|uniref:LOW QUALITY PROTEIN: tubulin tyrosine ligase 3-like n=1 Tax=Amphiura filiformis TaxID=82378 RepID=UPI003B224C25
MLHMQEEPAITGVRRAASAIPPPVSRPQSRSSSRGLQVRSPKSPQQFEFDSELTFSPKLNDTSLKLVQDRRDQNLSQQRPSSRSETRQSSEFTFRPQMSTASLKIAEGLGTTFMARQEMHLEKQKKLLEQSKQLKGRLSPVTTITKNKKTKDKENSDNSAWGTPTSTPNLTSRRRSSSHSPLNTTDSIHDFHHSGSTSLLDSQLNPLRGGRTMPPMQSSINLQRISETLTPYAPGNSLLVSRQKKDVKDRSPRLHKRSYTHPAEAGSNDSGNDSDTPGPSAGTHLRSKSPEPLSPRTKARVMAGQGSGPPTGERLRVAKLIAEKAIKKNKVFMIQGPYPVVRQCLRRRDWVEKQYRAMAPHKFKKKNDSDDDSDDDGGDPDDDNGCHGGSDVEDDTGLDASDSVYGIMSRIVRNHSPSFIWTVKASGIDYKFLKKDTYINHFPKNSAFTTKVGLCTHLRSLARFGTVDPDSFFPRCYKICSEEEKNAFVDDYRLTAACSIMKWVVQRHNGELDIPMDDNEDDNDDTADNEGGAASEENPPRPTSTTNSPKPKSTTSTPRKALKAKKNKTILATSLIERAIKVIDYYFSILDHEDIDWPLDSPPVMSEDEWNQFIREYYQLIHDGGIIQGSADYIGQCSSILNRLRASKLQVDMEGLRNIWIVKPGAKSRGRGITCMNKLEEIVKLVGSALVQKEGKWVVQKYIERPLLIYDTKFDIRQWFLVTDWNPLTVWFYKSSYLRFCGQIFSLDKFDSAIHLSNQSIQKYYSNCPTRSRMLPDDNMWTNADFEEYLQKRGCGNVWQDVVYPGMKNAVIAAMESCQDVLEPRKGCFELYGADFMLTEDFHPWLIEINSSPAMGATSDVTEKMCYDVIEDTMKVVLDRKYDKNCDTGDFELAFKQISVAQPQYVGQALSVEGAAVRRPLNRMKSSPNLVNAPKLSPRKCSEPTRSRTTVSKTEKALAMSDDPTLARATNLEEMKKKLAESPPQPSNSGTITPDSQGDSQPHQSTSSTTLVDVAWGRTCGRCGNGAGVKLAPDQADAKCRCRKDNLIVPAPFIQPPGKPLIPSFKVQEPIPRSGTFISNRKGELVTLNGRDPIQGMHKIGRAGFMQGKVKPNLNRNRRKNPIIFETVDSKILPEPFKHAVSNSLGR